MALCWQALKLLSLTPKTLWQFVVNLFLYFSLAGPAIASPLELDIVTPLFHYPPTFTVTCLTTLTPPTTLTWSQDGAPLNNTAQVLIDGLSSRYANILTVSEDAPGLYSCTAGNTRGAASLNITIQGQCITTPFCLFCFESCGFEGIALQRLYSALCVCREMQGFCKHMV